MIRSAIIALVFQIESLPPAAAEERLIGWAISDFRAHAPGQVRDFRAVHPASLAHPEGAVRPLLCGEVQVQVADRPPVWMNFATLETRGGYEQWLGGSARTWCHEDTKLDPGRDLSGRFKDALVQQK